MRDNLDPGRSLPNGRGTDDRRKSFPSLFENVGAVAAQLLAVGKLIFRHDAFNLVRFNPVSQTSICFDRHALNDRVDFWRLDIYPSLRSLAAMKDFVFQSVGM